MADRGHFCLERSRFLSFAECNAAFGEVVGRQFDANAIAGNDSDEVLSHTACDVGDDVVAAFQLDPKSSIGKGFGHRAINFDGFFFFWHDIVSRGGLLPRRQLLILNSIRYHRRFCHARLAGEIDATYPHDEI
jgi:hypothetical protein